MELVVVVRGQLDCGKPTSSQGCSTWVRYRTYYGRRDGQPTELVAHRATCHVTYWEYQIIQAKYGSSPHFDSNSWLTWPGSATSNPGLLLFSRSATVGLRPFSKTGKIRPHPTVEMIMAAQAMRDRDDRLEDYLQ